MRSRRSTLLARDYRAGVTKADVLPELFSHVAPGPISGARVSAGPAGEPPEPLQRNP